jgi:multidrug efflux pump subunit AcrB
MTKLIEWFLDRTFVVNLISFFIIVMGLISLANMNRDLIPPFQFQRILIQSQLPGASAVDLEKNVTFPIEEAIKNFAGIKRLDSSSYPSRSEINIEFVEGYDETDQAVERIRGIINGISNQLPEELEPVTVQRVRVEEVTTSEYSIRGLDPKSPEHRNWHNVITESLRRLPGVVNVTSDLQRRDIYVSFDSLRMNRLGISVSQARSALVEFFRYVPVGEFKINEDQISVTLSQEVESLERIRNLPVRGNQLGNSVRLKDFARVSYELIERENLKRMNGEESINLSIKKDITSDAIDLRDAVEKEIDRLRPMLPKSFNVQRTSDGAYYIEKQLKVLNNNLVTGMVLVAILLVWLLGGRVTFVTAWGIPIAYMGTFVVLDSLGVTLNLVSVVGMILIVGILVDDAIIVSERFTFLVQKGKERREAALEAARELINPVTGTIVTTIVAFSPILLIESQLSIILFSIPVVVITALSLSWFECFFILPNHLLHFAPKKIHQDPKILDQTREFYRRSLRFLLAHRYWTGLVVVAFFSLSIWIGTSELRQRYWFRVGQTRLNVYAVLKESPSLEASIAAVQPIEKMLLEKIPKEKLSHITTHVGRIWMDGRMREGFRYVRLKVFVPDTERYPRETREELRELVASELEKMDGSPFEALRVKQVKQGQDEAKDNMVSIYVRGNDEVSFEGIREKISESLEGLKAINAVYFDEKRVQRSWVFQPDGDALVRYGLTRVELARQIRDFFSPQELGRFRSRGESQYVFTQYERSEKPRFGEVNTIRIVTQKGLDVPITRLGKWSKEVTLQKIDHQNLRRTFSVDVAYDGDATNFDDVKKSIDERLASLRLQFPAYTFIVEEADLQAKENREWTQKIVYLCVALVLLVLALTLGTLTQPIIVGLAIPFGVIGIIWGLFTHNDPIKVMTIIGVIGVAGVSVNDSLILVDTANRLRSALIGEWDALRRGDWILEGSVSRLRAILLTTITTLGGVIPMAYGLGGESGFTEPLAFAMGWGLLFSTLLTLFLLPVLLAIREDGVYWTFRAGQWSWNRVRPWLAKRGWVE